VCPAKVTVAVRTGALGTGCTDADVDAAALVDVAAGKVVTVVVVGVRNAETTGSVEGFTL
jgi:hypothetical protein